MAFIKKIIILNEVTKGYGKAELRGLATVEKTGDRAVCRLTVFNLGEVKTGHFVFGVKSCSLRLQKFELLHTSQNFPLDKDTDVEGVISCVLTYKYTDKAVPLLWGSTDGRKIFEANMTDGFLDAPAERKPPEPVRKDIVKNIAENITEEAPVQKQTIVKKIEETAAAEKHEYMDCAVAAENFYPADYGTEMNATTVTTVPPPKMQPPEKAPVPVSPIHGGKFYAAIKSQLDELFENYPREEYLCQKLIGTDWVKVDYDNDDRYYTVGLIADEDRVKYICYGVPGKFAKLPPPELKGFCQWLPFDAETPEGEGYWMMYQDADSGKSVTLEII